MAYRGVFLCDGPSDAPLGTIIEQVCEELGRIIVITTPDFRRLPNPPGRMVRSRLQCVYDFGDLYDIIFVHRDAESETIDSRVNEVREAVVDVLGGLPAVAVVPIRMTEAWLLLDELAIREVAGRPSGTENLDLPPVRSVETIPNPKELLKDVLLRAGQPKDSVGDRPSSSGFRNTGVS